MGFYAVGLQKLDLGTSSEFWSRGLSRPTVITEFECYWNDYINKEVPRSTLKCRFESQANLTFQHKHIDLVKLQIKLIA